MILLLELEEIIGEVVDLSGIPVSEDTVLGEDIPVDSKDMLRILSRIESRYGFRFEPEEIMVLITVGDLLKTTKLKVKRNLEVKAPL